MQHPDHLDEGTIHAWLDGALDAGEQARVERHARECAACGALVAEARGMIAGASRIVSALDGVAAGVIPQRSAPAAVNGSLWRRLRVTPARASIAAALLVAAGTLLTVRHAPENLPAGKPVMTTPQSSVPATPARTAAPPVAVPTVAAQRPPATTGERRVSPKVAQVTARVDSMASVQEAKTEPAPRRSTADLSSAAAVVANAAPRLDSARAAPAAGAGVGGRERASVAAAPRQAMPLQLSERVVTDASKAFTANAPVGAQGFVGCYQTQSDSVSFLVPERFFLEQLTGGPGGEAGESPRNVVRAVESNGRIDSVFTEATWRVQRPGMVSVSNGAGSETGAGVAGRGRGGAPWNIQIVQGPAGLTAYTILDRKPIPVPIARVNCVR